MAILQHRYTHRNTVTDFISTLESIQINPTELCNRTCSFCPRGDTKIYKNRKLFLSTDISIHIGTRLAEINYKGRIGFVGFGEPLLHNTLAHSISIITNICKTSKWVEVNTNGDFLSRSIVLSLVDSGVTHITVSMYDGDDSEKYYAMCKGIPVQLTLRHSYNVSTIKIVDRIGILKGNTKNITRPCYIPFYKLFIDYNGDYLLCDQDWGRKTAQYNIKTTSISEYWSSGISKYRNNLIYGERYKNDLCQSCDVDGTLLGQDSFNFIKSSIS